METKKFLDGEGLVTLWKEITSLQSDYNETDETSPNYIKNKPFTIDVIPEEVIEEFTFTTSDTIDESTGLPTMQYVQLFNDLTIGQKMNLQFTYPELAAATGLPQYDDNGEVIFKIVRYENVEVGNFADAMGSQFLDSPAIMMGPSALIATLPESIQKVAIPNDDIVFVYSNATLANGAKTPLLITALMDWSTEGYSTYIATCHTSTFTTEKIDLIANRENHIALQSDWDEQNKENSAYIQNKPFGDEIILTPKNEFYRDSFIEWYGDESSGMGNPGYSLQAEPGKQYILQAFGNDGELWRIVLTCVDHTFEGIDLPEGAYFLGDFNNQGQLNSLAFLVDKAKFDSTQENLIYDENSCLIMFTDDLYKVVIHDTPLEGTYERTIINKIDKKYLPKADQAYDQTSENAQSGIAVNEAISKIQNRLPGSVITSLIAPTTLGDQHVKVQFDSTNFNTSPQSATWDIYTTGIGLNSDLKTSAKNTIVDAVNENVANLDDKQQQINKLKIQSNTRLDSIIDNNILINYDIATQSNNFIYLSDEDVEDEKISSQLYVRNLLNATPNNIIIAPTEDGFIWYDKKEYKVYRFTSNGIISLNKDYSNSEEDKKISDNFFANSSSYIGYYIDTPPKGSRHLNDFYIIKSTGEALSIGVDDDASKIYLYSQDPFYFDRPLLGTCSINYTGALVGTCYNLMISNTTDRYYPGKFNCILNGNDITIGEDNWSNIQSLGTFTRVLNEEGIEQVMVRVSGKSYDEPNIFTNIDNNKHSGYCNVDDNTIACLSSSKEILFRDKTNGSIIKRISLETYNYSDLFSNLQFRPTYFYNNCLYAVTDEAIYKMSNLDTNETPIINRIDIYQDAYTRKPGDIKLINNCLMFYDYSRISLGLNKSYSQHFLTGLPLKKILPKIPVKSDYNQTDSTQSDYIKNKPITAEYATNYLTKDKSIPVAQQMGNEAFVVEDQFINLVIGEKYDIDMNITSTIDNSTITHTFKDVECVDMCGFWKQSSACPGIVIAPELMLSLYPNLSYATLSDSLVFMYTNNFNGAAYDETKCITCVGEIDGTGAANTNITITVNVSQTSLEGEISEPYAKFLQADWLETDETKIGYIKNKTGASEYYSFNLKDFVDIEFGSTTINHTVSNPSSNAYYDTFTIAGLIGLGGMDNGKYVNITNIPYEVLYINDAPYLKNRQSFKNIGISSPSLKQFFNYDGIVWFDTIETLHKKWLKDGEFISLWTADNDSYSITAGFAIMGQVKRGSAVQEHHYSQQVRALWEAVFNDPETKIIIEYQDPKNIPHKEGQLILPLSTVEEEE